MPEIEIVSLFADGDQWCAALGEYPQCTNPEYAQGWGNNPSEALMALAKELEG